VHYNRARPDPCIVPNANSAQDFRAGSHDNIVPQGGMPFASFVASTPQSHILINQNIVPNLGGLPYHDGHAVVDKKTAAYGGAWMNFDAGEEARELRDHARQQRDARLVEPMGDAMEQNSVEPRIAQEDLEDALSGRVFAKYGVDLFPDCAKH